MMKSHSIFYSSAAMNGNQLSLMKIIDFFLCCVFIHCMTWKMSFAEWKFAMTIHAENMCFPRDTEQWFIFYF